jgi:kexin
LAAKDWTLVKPQAYFKTHSVRLANGSMPEYEVYSGGEVIVAGGVQSTITVTEDMVKEHNFETLEHLNIRVWISHGRRGDVEVELVSPHGIKSMLGAKRSGDAATTGYPGWMFMTVKHWYVPLLLVFSLSHYVC